MASFLGGLVGILACLAVTAALAAIPVTVAWHLWTRARQAHRRYSQPRRDPYDDAYTRTLESIARRNGERDAYRDTR